MLIPYFFLKDHLLNDETEISTSMPLYEIIQEYLDQSSFSRDDHKKLLDLAAQAKQKGELLLYCPACSRFVSVSSNLICQSVK